VRITESSGRTLVGERPVAQPVPHLKPRLRALVQAPQSLRHVETLLPSPACASLLPREPVVGSVQAEQWDRAGRIASDLLVAHSEGVRGGFELPPRSLPDVPSASRGYTAAVRDGGDEAVEAGGHQVAEDFRIQRLSQGGEAGDIREKYGDEATLTSPEVSVANRLLQRAAALITELGGRAVLPSTRRHRVVISPPR
jgi:hypothetical protein